MAYTNAQRRQHILELQKYLYAISLYNKKIPQIFPDGIYDQETAIAVRAFQREYGLPETGNTDPATWNKIVAVYRSYLNAEPIAYNVFPSPGYVVRSGDKGQLVYIIQAMLDDIGEKYENAPCVDICGSFNSATSDAVKLFQKRVGLQQTGTVDSGTWNMLVRCCEHIDSTIK